MKLTKRIEDILATMETVFEEELTEEGRDHVAALMDELRQAVRAAASYDIYYVNDFTGLG